MLNSDHLYYLIQTAKYGSITTAAEKMHITQPTVSLAIKKLEEQLHMQLLNRSFKGAHLTEDGQKVVQYAKTAFEYLDKIEAMASERNDSLMSEVTIYTIPALYNFLSDVAAEYYKQYPKGALRLLKLENPDLEALFAQQPNAFAVMISRVESIFSEDLDYVVLDCCKSYIRLRVDSDLLPKEQTSISCRELLGLPLILVDNGNKISQVFTLSLYEKLQRYGKPNVKFYVPDLNIANNYLLNDLGVCFYCDFTMMKGADATHASTRNVLIKGAPKFDIVLLYRKGHDPTRIRGIMELIDSAR